MLGSLCTLRFPAACNVFVWIRRSFEVGETVRPVMTPNPLVAFHNLPEL